jgi:methylated-DNA-[protein]-cysteine S-methyltransferase
MRALWFDTPLGAMVAVGDAQTLCCLHFGGARHLPDLAGYEDGRDCLLLRRVQLQVGDYFEGRRTGFELPLVARGTALQSAVWEALDSIALGTTISYGELASRVGRPRAVRAVAQAVGRNPWTLIRPCHRVVGADGSLTGFAGGLERKAALLAHEARLARAPGPAERTSGVGLQKGAAITPMRIRPRPASSG